MSEKNEEHFSIYRAFRDRTRTEFGYLTFKKSNVGFDSTGRPTPKEYWFMVTEFVPSLVAF